MLQQKNNKMQAKPPKLKQKSVSSSERGENFRISKLDKVKWYTEKKHQGVSFAAQNSYLAISQKEKFQASIIYKKLINKSQIL